MLRFLSKLKSYNLSILIVEDSMLSIKLLGDIFGKYFTNIDEASDGLIALQLFNAKQYDLIITDIEMPKMDGIGLTTAIREKNLTIPIVAVSVVSDKDRLIQLINAGITAFITKPFNAHIIEEQIYRIFKPFIDNLESTQKTKDLENQFEAMFKVSRDGIAILDENAKFLVFNDAYINMLGYSADELSKFTCIQLSTPEDTNRTIQAIRDAVKNSYVENFEKTCINKSGSRVSVSMNISIMPGNKKFLVSTRNITEAKKIRNQLDNYIALVDESVITSSTDIEGKITYVSNAFCKISKYPKEELIGKPHNIVRHPDVSQELFKNMWETIGRDETWQWDILNSAKDDSAYWVYATVSPVYDEYNHKIGYTSIRQDITDKKTIEQMAITDSMTSLFNRRYFNDMLPRMFNSARREDKTIGFLLLDIDYFKQYNDTYGHQKGDDVLVLVANVMKDTFQRAGDFCFRLGGEEFGIIFVGTPKESAIGICNRLKQNIESLKIKHIKNTASQYVTASFGLAIRNANENTNLDDLYKEADEYLYQAKDNGRNIMYYLMDN